MATAMKEYDEIVKSLDDNFDYIDMIEKLPVCGICLKWQHEYVVNKINNIDTLLIRFDNLKSILTNTMDIDQKMEMSNAYNIVYNAYKKKLTNLKSKNDIDD